MNDFPSTLKYSGIQWVGDIPEMWRVYPAGRLFSEVKEKNRDNLPYTPLSFRYGEIVDKKINGSSDEDPSEALSAYTIVHPGVIMLNGLNLNYDFITQRVALVRKDGIITSAYLAITPNVEYIIPEFATYLLKSYDYKMVFHGIGSGIRKTLKYSDFKTIKAPVPSIPEQQAIVAYLDSQVAQIDFIIAEVQASIEEYKMWKASVIFEAITKGLNPSVALKRSNDQRIGMIPAHWKLTKVKQVSLINPPCPVSGLRADDEVTFAPMECIRTDRRIPKTAPLSNNNSSYSSFCEGDIALAKVTPCFQNSNVCIMEGLVNGYAFGSSELFNVRPIGINRRFLLYFFMTEAFKDGGVASMTGVAGLQRVSSTYIRNAVLPYPDEKEQNDIVAYLDDRCNSIDGIVEEKESLISDLETYKRSLIYETVTGKRKVV